MAAPVRGARILLTDNMGVRADMTASWLAQMGWEIYVLEGGYDGALEVGPPQVLPKPDPSHRYRRPYEGTDVDTGAMQAYLDWEYGLVEQLRRDATHGFFCRFECGTGGNQSGRQTPFTVAVLICARQQAPRHYTAFGVITRVTSRPKSLP